jgi:UDP-N-acetylmuramyl pentapeptide phosphotransferase/UDP-N-acetylglucosamine-1-phosphate transferase
VLSTLDTFTLLYLLFELVLLVYALVALVIGAMTREDAYRATDKKTKKFWVGLLGAVVAVYVLAFYVNLGPLQQMVQLAGLVATIVFWVDVRPAVRAISGGGRGGGRGRKGGSSSDGPYGPYNGGR